MVSIRARFTELAVLLTAIVATNVSICAAHDSVQIDNIIVTAEKREQDLQSVPSAITAFTGEGPVLRGLDTPQYLQLITHGLSIIEGYVAGIAQASIRGVGFVNIYAGDDSGVPIHINGHYTQSTAYLLRDFLDVERVEVQRGPQGTQYGRNSVGGNVNIITKRPTDELEAMVIVDAGNYSKRLLQSVISGPLGDRFRGRLVVADEEGDGYIADIGIGGDRADSNYTSVRAAFDFDLNDSVNFYLNAYNFDDKSRRGMAQTVYSDFEFSNPFTVRTNFPTDQHDKSKGVTLHISWNFGSLELRSLSAYDETRKNGGVDYDGTDVGRSENINSENNYDIFAQEIQLLSQGDGPWQWASGIFYYEKQSTAGLNIFFDFSTSSSPLFDTNGDGIVDVNDPRYGVLQVSDIVSESFAAYTQIEYAFSDHWQGVAGIRYTKDEKSLSGFRPDSVEGGLQSLSPLADFMVDQSWDRGGDWSEPTGKLGVNYYFASDAMLCGSYSRGYKAGGIFFNAAGAVYDPEIIDPFEVGLKSRWLSDRVQLNVASYYYDYTDKQEYQRLPPPDAGLSNIKNAAAASVYGLEVEAQTFLTDSILVDTMISLMHAEYDRYETIDNANLAAGLQDLSGMEKT